MTHQEVESTTVIAAKVAPPVAVSAIQLAGISVEHWILWLTLFYTVLMLAHKLWKMGREGYEFWVLKKRHSAAEAEE